MTTPWKTWMRERLPSTTRTCTLTESPGRKSGMSPRNESASSASRVFIAAVLSASSGSRSVQTAENARPSESVAATSGSAAALYCATCSGEDVRRPRRTAPDQTRQQLRELRGHERLVGGGDLLGAPPPV